MVISLAHCCTCEGRLKALQPGLKAADPQVIALKRDQRGAPAVAEAVRQRCSHIAATKSGSGL
jgi:cell wall assembly regulator SMI1